VGDIWGYSMVSTRKASRIIFRFLPNKSSYSNQYLRLIKVFQTWAPTTNLFISALTVAVHYNGHMIGNKHYYSIDISYIAYTTDYVWQHSSSDSWSYYYQDTSSLTRSLSLENLWCADLFVVRERFQPCNSNSDKKHHNA